MYWCSQWAPNRITLSTFVKIQGVQGMWKESKSGTRGEAYLSGRIRWTLTKADNLTPFELTNMRVSVQYMYITLVNIITHYGIMFLSQCSICLVILVYTPGKELKSEIFQKTALKVHVYDSTAFAPHLYLRNYRLKNLCLSVSQLCYKS